jgi:FAD/FMN-containing dehydrogenase
MQSQAQVSPSASFKTAADRLQSRLRGSVSLPEQAGYDDARRAWNLTVDQRPAVIVSAKNADDIAEAVRFAREQNLKVGVMSGGHGINRPADGALLIVTSQLKDLQIDAEARTARLGAGLKWGAVLAQAQAHGLAPLLGSSPDVGVVGYTLGGGMGWLARKYGLAVDSVRAFEVVTADGSQVKADAQRNPDLFWALRGGGGNFGVVTAMEIQLYPVETVYGGNLFYPAELAGEVAARYRDWIAGAPDELTSALAFMNFPPLPQVPEFLRGKSVVIVRGCFCGPVEAGEALLRPWREWRAPLLDGFHAMPFSQVAAVSQDPEAPTASLGSGALLSELGDAAIPVLLRNALPGEQSCPLVSTEIRHAGGAINRVDPRQNAFSRRDGMLAMHMIGMAPSPEAARAVGAHIARFKQELAPYLAEGVYLNFVDGEEALRYTREAFAPDTYRRLKAVKAQYDPQNVFCFHYDITPEAD